MDNTKKSIVASITAVIGLLFAWWNGAFLNWHQKTGSKNTWKIMGIVIRALLLVLLYLLSETPFERWLFTAAGALVVFPLYNITINWIRGDRWDYLGDGTIDQNLKKHIWLMYLTYALLLVNFIVSLIFVLLWNGG